MSIEEKLLPVTIRTISIDGKRLTKSFLEQLPYEEPIPNSKPIGWVKNIFEKDASFIFVGSGGKYTKETIVLWVPDDENVLKKCYRSLEQVKRNNIEQIFI